MHAVRPSRRALGFTIVEVLLVVAIVGILAGIAIPAYMDYRERARVKHAITELTVLSLLINQYQIDRGQYPPALAAVANASKPDPWGRPYVYLNLQNPALKGKGQFRKNKNLVPINSDYDLYSVGKDGASVGPLTAGPSRDDVIRANDGAFFGLARDYEP